MTNSLFITANLGGGKIFKYSENDVDVSFVT